MIPYSEYFKVIYLHEVGSSKNGGLINHPKDPGGITKYGISLRFLKSQGLDIDGDGDVDADDVRALTFDKSGLIYKQYFFNRLYRLSDGLLKLHIFDMSVNAGNKTAVKILQKSLCISDDGIIGNQTLQAIDRQSQVNNVAGVYALARMDYYKFIVDRNPDLSCFLNGWENRVRTTQFIK